MEDRDPHRALSDIEKRIKEVRGDSEPETETTYSSAGVALRIGIDLIAGVAFGVGAGLLLDSWLDTTPWMLIVMIILGTAAGIRNVIRTAEQAQRRQQQK